MSNSAFAPFNTVKDFRDRGFRLKTPPLMIAGYDPAGDGDDRDALVLNAREEWQKGEPWDPDFAVITAYRVLLAYRMPQAFEFPDKLAMLLALHRNLVQWRHKKRCHNHVFTVETNGVGYGISSALRSQIGANVIPYITVARLSDRGIVERRRAMPRLPALDHLRILAETHMLKIANDCPGRTELMDEVNAFVWRRAGRPEAMAGAKDDQIMALCGTTWMGTKVIPPILKQQKFGDARVRVN